MRVQVLLLLLLITGCATATAWSATRAKARPAAKAGAAQRTPAPAAKAAAAKPAGRVRAAVRKAGAKRSARARRRGADRAEPQFQPYVIQNWPEAALERMPRVLAELPPPPDLPSPCRLCETRLLATAYELIGTRYRLGGTRPETGFDCSGFVRYLYEQNFSLALPPSAPLQYQVGFRVEPWELEPGDLVFFRTRRGWHVGMYVGNDAFIHAPNRRKTVRISPLFSDPYWRRAFVGARRIPVPQPAGTLLADDFASNNN
ncbi:MAG: C40 family peptidase [Bryobacteraceae bacterium]|nr:C40 family peptidase [Bryobacteraceae bacterium]